jgi:hypothetical protein
MPNEPETISYINLGDGEGNHPIDAVTLNGKTAVSIMESGIVTSIDSSSTDQEYPSAKCMYTIFGEVENRLESI